MHCAISEFGINIRHNTQQQTKIPIDAKKQSKYKNATLEIISIIHHLYFFWLQQKQNKSSRMQAFPPLTVNNVNKCKDQKSLCINN